MSPRSRARCATAFVTILGCRKRDGDAGDPPPAGARHQLFLEGQQPETDVEIDATGPVAED